MDYLTTSAAVIAPPICGFAANIGLRRIEALKSSGTDWLLMLWVIDMTLAISVGDIYPLIPGAVFKEICRWLFLTLGFGTISIWLIAGLWIEPVVRDEKCGLIRRALLFIATYSVAMTVTAFNIFIFIYRG